MSTPSIYYDAVSYLPDTLTLNIIEFDNEDVRQVEVSPFLTIREFRNFIADGDNPDLIQLNWGGDEPLEDLNRTIGSYDIQPHENIIVRRIPALPPPPRKNLFTAPGSTFGTTPPGSPTGSPPRTYLRRSGGTQPYQNSVGHNYYYHQQNSVGSSPPPQMPLRRMSSSASLPPSPPPSPPPKPASKLRRTGGRRRITKKRKNNRKSKTRHNRK